MEFPSKARPAARPLLRLRGGGGAADLGPWTLRQLRALLRSGPWERLGRAAGPTRHLRTPVSDGASICVPQREPMMRRPASAGFSIADLDSGTSHTLVLEGELDAGAVPALEAAIGRYCADGVGALTLDLSKLTFIDSSGLWTILAVMRWSERQGRGFSVVPGPDAVQQVFEVTGLIDVLPFRAPSAPD